MNRRLFLFAAFALCGCATTRIVTSPSPLGELEPLYRADAGRDGLTIRVASNGCTAKDDFTFYVEFSFGWTELGVPPRTPVFLLNPLVAGAGP